MDNLRWRVSAKVVAYVQLILWVLLLPLILAFGLCVFVLIFTEADDIPLTELDFVTQIAKGKIGILWAGVGILTMEIGLVAIWGAIELIEATEPGQNIMVSLSCARTWRNLNVIFVAIGIISLLSFFFDDMISLIVFKFVFVYILIQTLMIFIVCMFIQELEILSRAPVTHFLKA